MNWLDIVLLVLLAGSVITAFSKGITREVVGLAAVVLGLLLGSWFYGSVAAVLLPYLSSPALANLFGFLVVFLGVVLLGGIIGFLLGKLLKITGLSFLDRVLGAGFGAVRGVLVAIALVMALMAFTPGGGPPGAVVNSRLAPYVIDAARVVSALTPHELKSGFHKSYEQVKSAWGTVKKTSGARLPGAVNKKNEREI